MAKAALQTAAGALNGMTLGSGLAIGGLALGLGGWQLGSAIDKATDHSYRALLAAEHWGAHIAVWKSTSASRRLAWRSTRRFNTNAP